MKFPSVLVATALLTGLSGAARAADNDDFSFDTTEDLYQVCATPAEAATHIPAALACRAFIEATMQYHDQISHRKKMKRLVCYDETATIANGQAAFVAWAKDRQADAKLMKEQPVVGVVRALAARYPCK